MTAEYSGVSEDDIERIVKAIELVTTYGVTDACNGVAPSDLLAANEFLNLFPEELVDRLRKAVLDDRTCLGVTQTPLTYTSE